jgi:signal transduction histidine kinase/CheY-like chemotaxis protein
MSHEISYIRFYFIGFIIGLILLIGGSLTFNIYSEYQSVEQYAKTEAIACYKKDVLYRRWAAMHGGVYVPVTELTQPNPYLAFIPERDITTPSGKKLTLVNPAYMTRQVFTLQSAQNGILGHITSLKPLRPENKADAWETIALKSFERGDSELFSIKTMNKTKYFRYMKAMKVEQSCLKCHASQGYKIGDIRGGISVSVPLTNYLSIAKHQIKYIILTHLLIFIIIFVFTYWGYKRLLHEMKSRNEAQNQIVENELRLQEQNKEYAALNQEYKIQNENLIITKEKAEESEKLKTAFLQNISHEIRTPLNAILGFSDFLENQSLSPEKRKNFISIVKNSANQLLAVVSNTLTISSLETKQEKINNERFSLNTVIKELENVFKIQANLQKTELKTSVALSDSESEIITDKTKITQVLSNLVANALKFTHEGVVEFGYSLQENEIVIFVKDSGIGIKPEMINVIFERFRQADSSINRKYGGTGLGLSISKGYVELLGGKIWVDSEIDKGSTFYFTLPYKLLHFEEKAVNVELKHTIKTILIAEDEEYNYILLVEMLKEKGYALIHANNGREAVNICNSNPNIDLVLMDIKMPMMDGQVAAKQIKVNHPNLPIIAQTAYALEHEIKLYFGIGFDDYITKPIKREILLEKIVHYTSENNT